MAAAVTTIPGFVIRGAIRSKKTSQQIITIATKGSHRCRACGKMSGFHKIIPSDAHKAWHDAAMPQCVGIKLELARRGVILPIRGGISLEAHFYQDVNRADAVGLYESIADLLQDAEIISNDQIIEDWDGSRRLVDRKNPRTEVYLTVLQEVAVQETLELAKGLELKR